MSGQGLDRPREGRILAGVCAGIARHYGWNVTVVRAAFVLFGIFGAGEIAYLALWIIMPKASR